MKFIHLRFTGSDNFKLAQAHLEHHIALEKYFISYHHKGTRSATDVPQIKLGFVGYLSIESIWLGRHILNLTVSPANKALTNNHVVTGRVSTQASSVVANNIDIVEQLAFHCF
jgi:hypothetical protein